MSNVCFLWFHSSSRCTSWDSFVERPVILASSTDWLLQLLFQFQLVSKAGSPAACLSFMFCSRRVINVPRLCNLPTIRLKIRLNVSTRPYLDNVYYTKWDLQFEVCHYGIIYNADGDLCVLPSLSANSINIKIAKRLNMHWGNWLKLLQFRDGCAVQMEGHKLTNCWLCHQSHRKNILFHDWSRLNWIITKK